MKRFIFSAIALMVAVTSCTESGLIDTPDFYGKAIVFDTYIGKNPITKAQNYGEEQLKGTDSQSNLTPGAQICAFYQNPSTNKVDYSSAYMDGHLIWKGTAWAYQTQNNGNCADEETYWPIGYNLAFVAYSLNAETEGAITNQSADKTQFNFTVKDAVASQTDLLATPLTPVSENPNGDTQVNLQFYHLLSRVGFKVLATNATNATISISSVKLCGAFPRVGYVDLTSKVEPARPEIVPNTSSNIATEYNLFASGESFSVVTSACATTAQPVFGDVESNRYMMLMPGPQTNASIVVEYSLSNENVNHTATVPLASTWNFEAGKAYEFILKISTATIEFSAEVVEGSWDEQTPEEKPL